MSTVPLTIYLSLPLATQIKQAAKRDGQSQSAYVGSLLEHHFAEDLDPLSVLVTNQLSRLLAVSEEWVDTMPEPRRNETRDRIKERTERFQKVAQERLKS